MKDPCHEPHQSIYQFAGICRCGCTARVIRDHQRAELLALGEEAVNRALKDADLAIAYFRQYGIDVHRVMEFADETIDEDERQAIRLIVEPQSSLDLPVVDGS